MSCPGCGDPDHGSDCGHPAHPWPESAIARVADLAARVAEAEKALEEARSLNAAWRGEAEAHQKMRLDAEKTLALVADWLEDEIAAGLQVPLPILATLAFGAPPHSPEAVQAGEQP